MTHACQLTDVSKHEIPELIQFYQYSSHKYPFVLTTSGQQEGVHYDILFIEPEDWLALDHHYELKSSPNLQVNQGATFLDAFDVLFTAENEKYDKLTQLQSQPLNQSLNQSRNESTETSSLPFTGGWFVFLAYELAQQIEPCLDLTCDPSTLPVAYASRVKKALIFDHQQKKYFFISESEIDHDKSLEILLNDCQAIQKSIHKKEKKSKITRQTLEQWHHSLAEDDKNHFLNSVKKVKRYIKDGDVFQVNLSRLWQSETLTEKHSQQAFSLSRLLSEKNPAPFSGLAQFDTRQGSASIISSSPERLLKVKNNHLESRPIAGTHPRSQSIEEDAQLLNDLHAHPKEQAEHIMLIDLIRNDLGRVCIPGSVTVDELMVNETYAHVHHIVSNVSGEIQVEKTPGDIIKAMFPGGTITGCPKVRCMEIISELEEQSRGAYTGSMGFINLDGSMDLNILIRTMVLETSQEASTNDVSGLPDSQSNQKLSFRAGAGLVFDSVAEKELNETRAKAKGLLSALNSEFTHE